jgi:hypothetical protein
MRRRSGHAALEVPVALPVVADDGHVGLDSVERPDGDNVTEVVVGVAADGGGDDVHIDADGALEACGHVGVEADVVRGHKRAHRPTLRRADVMAHRGHVPHSRAARCLWPA